MRALLSASVFRPLSLRFSGSLLLLLVASPAPALQWLHNLDAAKQRAKQQHRILLVDFYADWCGPCRAMDAQVWNQPELAAFSSKFVFVRLDYDRERTTAEYYEVKVIPTMLFLDTFDNKALHVRGYRTTPQMLALMQPFPDNTTALDEQFTRTRQGKDNHVLKLDLADRYRESGMFLLSNKLYAEAAKSKTLRQDATLVEKVEMMMAVNLSHLDAPERAVAALGECLDKYPSSPNRAALLLGLIRAGMQGRDLVLGRGNLRAAREGVPWRAGNPGGAGLGRLRSLSFTNLPSPLAEHRPRVPRAWPPRSSA